MNFLLQMVNFLIAGHMWSGIQLSHADNLHDSMPMPWPALEFLTLLSDVTLKQELVVFQIHPPAMIVETDLNSQTHALHNRAIDLPQVLAVEVLSRAFQGIFTTLHP